MINKYFNELFAEISARMNVPAFIMNEEGYARCEVSENFVVDIYADSETRFLYLSSKLGQPRSDECGELLRSLLIENRRNSKPLDFYFSFDKETRSILVFSSMQLLDLTPDLVFSQIINMHIFFENERLRLIDELFS